MAKKLRVVRKPRNRKQRTARPVKRIRRKTVSTPSKHGESFDAGYNKGFNEGYDQGYEASSGLVGKDYQQGYEEGFQNGIYSGGDEIVDQLLPYDRILPYHSIQDIIAAGIERLQEQTLKLLTADETASLIRSALSSGHPLSLVRIGDGELLTLAQDVVMSCDEVKRKGPFLEYAGVHIPDAGARERLADSIRRASIVGIPKLRLPNFQPLTVPVFRAHGLSLEKMNLTLSTINYELFTHDRWIPLLKDRKVLAIGRKAGELTRKLTEAGMRMETPITEVNGVNDVSRVMELVRERRFDLALVCAGIAAVIIAENIATQLGKVALDFGHLADSIVNGEAPLVENPRLTQ